MSRKPSLRAMAVLAVEVAATAVAAAMRQRLRATLLLRASRGWTE
jgi:hypothetical protein